MSENIRKIWSRENTEEFSHFKRELVITEHQRTGEASELKRQDDNLKMRFYKTCKYW
jgi:hypothetical protein